MPHWNASNFGVFFVLESLICEKHNSLHLGILATIVPFVEVKMWCIQTYSNTSGISKRQDRWHPSQWRFLVDPESKAAQSAVQGEAKMMFLRVPRHGCPNTCYQLLPSTEASPQTWSILKHLEPLTSDQSPHKSGAGINDQNMFDNSFCALRISLYRRQRHILESYSLMRHRHKVWCCM